ncbi:MAG TPA: flagellar biosynthetic protein FliO [Acidimicrobiales bacterium]|nr:flagellar biosynthetic protein FliO [Acidimicrobiales bacterium]
MGAAGMLLKVVVVFGLLFVTLRVVGRLHVRKSRPSGRGTSVEVLSRSSLSRNSSVVLVRIADRRLALGVTDQSVHVLTEVTPADDGGDGNPDADPDATSSFHTALPARTQGNADRPTWRELVESVRERTVRR